MIRWILIGLLTISLIGVGYWGYKGHSEKNTLLIHAENDYQRSFHQLAYNMDMLHDKIGTSLAMNSGKRLSPQFVDIWRLSSSAQSDVSQLPLSLMPIQKTQEFLSNIGNFTYKTAIRNLDDDPLTDEEIEVLNKYYEQANIIKDELREAQYLTLKENLRWMDIDDGLQSNEQMDDNSIIGGLQTVEDGVGEFIDGNKDNPLMIREEKDLTFKGVRGNRKSEDEIKEFSKDLFSIKNKDAITITKSLEGADVANYNVFYEDDQDEKSIFMDVTEKGANPVTILVNRPIGEQNISLNEGFKKAEKYLKKFKYKNMQKLQSQQFDNYGVYTFTYSEDDVKVYPDTVVVKVALDNGDIIGFNARNYLINHHDRNFEKPKITIDEAESYVNGNLKLQDDHLALIENSVGEEVLTYAFLGTLGDETYRIFINAKDGTEEKVEKLTETEMNFEVMM